MKFTYEHSCFKMFSDGSQSGHLNFKTEIRISECENEYANDCLRKLCHQATLSAGAGNDNPLCDGTEWAPVEHTLVPRFGKSGNSMSGDSTASNIMIDAPKPFFEFEFGGILQPPMALEPFMFFGDTRRCYIHWNVTDSGQTVLMAPNCVMTDRYFHLTNGGIGTSELQNQGPTTMDDYDSNGMLKTAHSCTGSCCNKFDTGDLEGAPLEFISCEHIKRDCSDALISRGCEKTCGMCKQSSCEDPGGCCNMADLEGARAPFPGFKSCRDEIGNEPDACFDNDYVKEGCALACKTCQPASYVRSDEYAGTGSYPRDR